jgi:hypothetical protein
VERVAPTDSTVLILGATADHRPSGAPAQLVDLVRDELLLAEAEETSFGAE